MSEAPKDIESLIDLMARLPGLGPRSARRAVLHLIKKRGQVMAPLAEGADRLVACAQPLGDAGDVGRDPVLFAGEQRAGSAHAAQHGGEIVSWDVLVASAEADELEPMLDGHDHEMDGES